MVGALLLLRKDKQGRKSVETTKENIHKAQDGIQRFKRQRAAKSMETRAKKLCQTVARLKRLNGFLREPL